MTTVLVLVVEDDEDFRRLVTRVLTGWGHEVVEAGVARGASEDGHEEWVSVASLDRVARVLVETARRLCA